MKKLKYYAPYWVSAIIAAALAALLLIVLDRITPFSELPELAAGLEESDMFIREDGVVMTSEGSYGSTEALTGYNNELHWIGQPKAKVLHEMLPHEYAAMISEDKIYLRQDGGVFVRINNYPGIAKECIEPICLPSELPESAAEIEAEINAASGLKAGTAIEVLVPAANMEAALTWQLSVRLSDGWYGISDGSHERIKVSKSSDTCYLLYVQFPALHEGDYRLELCIDGEWYYQQLALTRKSADDYTLTW